MLDLVFTNLKNQITPELIQTFGLTQVQASKTIDITSTSLTDVVKTHATSNIGGLLNLFSLEANNTHGNTIFNHFSETLTANLTSKVGVTTVEATYLANYITPVITQFISEKVGGNSEKLMSMFGGLGENLLNDLAGGLMKNKIQGLFN